MVNISQTYVGNILTKWWTIRQKMRKKDMNVYEAQVDRMSLKSYDNKLIGRVMQMPYSDSLFSGKWHYCIFGLGSFGWTSGPFFSSSNPGPYTVDIYRAQFCLSSLIIKWIAHKFTQYFTHLLYLQG